MKTLSLITIIFALFISSSFSQEKTTNLSQYYGGKFGFYKPDKKLNNGLLFGIDGITEFNKYNFLLSGAFDFFEEPKTDVNDHLF